MKNRFFFTGSAIVLLGSAYAFWSIDRAPTSGEPGQQVGEPGQQVKRPAETVANLSAGPAAPNQTKRLPAGSNENRASGASPDSLPVPAPIDDSPQDWPSTVRLWDEAQGNASTTIDGIPATRLQVNPARLREFHVGQTLNLDIPQSGTEFEAKISDTHNTPAGVKVWLADIVGDRDEAGLIISQGKTQTHVIIASERGNYSAIIDNQTGDSTLVDEGEINARQIPFDDGIAVGPPEDSTLPPIN